MELPRTRTRVCEGERAHGVQKLKVVNDRVTRAKLKETVDVRRAYSIFRSCWQPITNLSNII